MKGMPIEKRYLIELAKYAEKDGHDTDTAYDTAGHFQTNRDEKVG